VSSLGALVRFEQPVAKATDQSRFAATFRGTPMTTYYVGSVSYTHQQGSCSGSFVHERDDPDAFKVLQQCEGHCQD